MGSTLRFAAALLALASRTTATLNDPVVVAVDSLGVQYRGLVRESVEEFNSVKFGIRDAIPPFFGATPDQSEDCLYLRITRPQEQKASVDPTHLMTQSARIGQPVIHVVLNYRVTIFGFARLPVLKDQQSLNVGMRDQRAGFQWVKDHIAAFGGDQNRITSFGLSSGGTFTSLHLLSYGGARGVPFDRAWCMSGPPGTALDMTSDAVELHTRAVANKLGCDASGDDFEVLQCLRDVPMDKLTETAMAYAMKNHPPAGLFTFIPSVDDDFLPDRQSVLYRAGRFVKMPMVHGWTQDDGGTNAGPATDFQTEADIITAIRRFPHALTDDDYAGLFALYPASDFDNEVRNYEARRAASDPAVSVHYFRAARILRDVLFTCSSLDFASEASKRSTDITLTPMFRAAGMPWLGAVHGSDLEYLYNNLLPRETLADADLALADRFLAAFLNFAYAADPNGADAALSWPEAFPTGADAASSLSTPAINVQLVGGPWGTESCHLAADAGAGEDSSLTTRWKCSILW
ncbi:lipase [Apiospora phragmitis]|uniref:Lipase n=1 Tax=Apiospora phragmitis TaxID=2905665 RepID=A0ABR1T4V8_9PEZI